MALLLDSLPSDRSRWAQTGVALGLLVMAAGIAYTGDGPLTLGLGLVVGLFALGTLYVQTVRSRT